MSRHRSRHNPSASEPEAHALRKEYLEARANFIATLRPIELRLGALIADGEDATRILELLDEKFPGECTSIEDIVALHMDICTRATAFGLRNPISTYDRMNVIMEALKRR